MNTRPYTIALKKAPGKLRTCRKPNNRPMMTQTTICARLLWKGEMAICLKHSSSSTGASSTAWILAVRSSRSSSAVKVRGSICTV